jgi:hypothetical protein
VLIADNHFIVERAVAGGDPASIATNDRPLAIMSLDCRLEVTCNDTAIVLQRYQTTLVPAAAPWCTVRAPVDRSPFMLVTLPHDREQLAVQLLAAGVAQETVDTFMAQF